MLGRCDKKQKKTKNKIKIRSSLWEKEVFRENGAEMFGIKRAGNEVTRGGQQQCGYYSVSMAAAEEQQHITWKQTWLR